MGKNRRKTQHLHPYIFRIHRKLRRKTEPVVYDHGTSPRAIVTVELEPGQELDAIGLLASAYSSVQRELELRQRVSDLYADTRCESLCCLNTEAVNDRA